ncbi:TetR/AcrR family transcriptional regulator [Enterococcus sp. DIV1298c]|uniref:TetR/AcrR family transcriptional regulator n=1 Tax=Enterococcus sp. DIV1298c TaxID=2815328 RepID=UPI001A937D48|nr:TetR/AcrR family transcriptional regulator [Enterococcus sp. DIV1298c]MBO0462235.1 TetR/AcrR family transcriptional regulator [Enterococcus sp. DIV1298c]
MKYDFKNKTNRFSQRTLFAFSTTLMDLLEKKSFEKITISELCEACNYPRATFYNYFDDSYDLLNYCWIIMMQEIKIDDYLSVNQDEIIYVLFDRIYDYFDSYRDRLEKIMRNNLLDGVLAASFNQFIKQQSSRIMRQFMCNNQQVIPYELVSDHYSNTLQLIMEWIFLREKNVTKEVAHNYLKYLLNNFGIENQANIEK